MRKKQHRAEEEVKLRSSLNKGSANPVGSSRVSSAHQTCQASGLDILPRMSLGMTPGMKSGKVCLWSPGRSWRSRQLGQVLSWSGFLVAFLHIYHTHTPVILDFSTSSKLTEHFLASYLCVYCSCS